MEALKSHSSCVIIFAIQVIQADLHILFFFSLWHIIDTLVIGIHCNDLILKYVAKMYLDDSYSPQARASSNQCSLALWNITVDIVFALGIAQYLFLVAVLGIFRMGEAGCLPAACVSVSLLFITRPLKAGHNIRDKREKQGRLELLMPLVSVSTPSRNELSYLCLLNQYSLIKLFFLTT